jgi:lipoyl(octanoyl) transferase
LEVAFATDSRADVLVRRLGRVDYLGTWERMRRFTLSRRPEAPDEIWLLEHPAVYTVGLNGKPEHWPRGETSIPIVNVDRGGQITYHGPGQVIVYLLLDLRRMGIGVRALVRKMEQAVIDLLREYGVEAEGQVEAPGVYVQGAKIAALGLRVKNGCCYHGLAFNVDMDLAPFFLINPCGYPGLRVIQARALGIRDSMETLGEKLVTRLIRQLALPPVIQ